MQADLKTSKNFLRKNVAKLKSKTAPPIQNVYESVSIVSGNKENKNTKAKQTNTICFCFVCIYAMLDSSSYRETGRKCVRLNFVWFYIDTYQ